MLKVIVLRMGGVKLYEKIMPLMVGIAAALEVAVILGDLAVAMRPH